MRVPLVNIIIATYNAGEYLDACLTCILSQHVPELRIIIIDGGSTDNTLNVIHKHEASIYHWQSEPDQGVYDAMNKGIKFVSSGWVLFLGADDLLENGFKAMVSELKEPNGIYYGMVDVGGVIYKGPYSDYRLSKLNICHQAIFYPAHIFAGKYQYNLAYPLWADWLLNIECWKDPELKFIYKPHLVSKFGMHGISSHQPDQAFERDRKKIIIKHLGLFTWLRYSFRAFKKKLLN